MDALLFLGCTVPVRNLNYELSARKVSAKLGITLHDHPELGCCGYPLKAGDQEAALIIAARALALAAPLKMPLVPLCSACAGALAEAAHRLDHDQPMRSRVNRRLASLGLEYQSGVEVKHFARLLYQDIGLEAVKARITTDLSDYTFAPHYGCHYLKPSNVLGFDDPEDPKSIAELIALTGARSLDYSSMKDCCGGGVLGVDELLAGSMAGVKLAELNDRQISAMVVSCPFCNVMYEGQQKKIAKTLETRFKVPVVYLTQVLGLGMGFEADELGFKLNRVKPKELIKAFSRKAAGGPLPKTVPKSS